MPLVELIAARLRELRARHGLTQEQAAALLNADVRWYQRLELGAKDMRVSTVDRLATIFGLTAAEFLAATESKSKVSSRHLLPPTSLDANLPSHERWAEPEASA